MACAAPLTRAQDAASGHRQPPAAPTGARPRKKILGDVRPIAEKAGDAAPVDTLK